MKLKRLLEILTLLMLLVISAFTIRFPYRLNIFLYALFIILCISIIVVKISIVGVILSIVFVIVSWVFKPSGQEEANAFFRYMHDTYMDANEKQKMLLHGFIRESELTADVPKEIENTINEYIFTPIILGNTNIVVDDDNETIETLKAIETFEFERDYEITQKLNDELQKVHFCQEPTHHPILSAEYFEDRRYSGDVEDKDNIKFKIDCKRCGISREVSIRFGPHYWFGRSRGQYELDVIKFANVNANWHQGRTLDVLDIIQRQYVLSNIKQCLEDYNPSEHDHHIYIYLSSSSVNPDSTSVEIEFHCIPPHSCPVKQYSVLTNDHGFAALDE